MICGNASYAYSHALCHLLHAECYLPKLLYIWVSGLLQQQIIRPISWRLYTYCSYECL